MKLKIMFSKIVAVLCIVSLLVGTFQMTAFQTEAATEAKSAGGYDLVTLSELTTGTYSAGNITKTDKTTYTKCSELTWEGTVFEGTFKFDYTGKDEGNLLLLGSTAASRGLKIFINSKEQLQIRLIDNGNPGGTARPVDIYITASNLGLDSLKTELKLKINFDFTNPNVDANTADVAIRVQVNDYSISVSQTAFQLEYMKRVAWIQGTTSYPLYHNSQYENAYDIVTFSDLADTEAEQNGILTGNKTFSKYSDLNWDNTMFEGMFQFDFTGTNEANMLVLGSTVSGGGLKIFINDAGQLQIRLLNGTPFESSVRYKDVKINAVDLGLTSLIKTPLKLSVKIDFADIDTTANTAEVTVCVRINDKYDTSLKLEKFQLVYMKRVVWLIATTGYDLTYGPVDTKSMTFTDFGFDETTTAEAGIMKYADEKSTYDHVSVEGNYIFSQGNESNFVIFGRQWYGVRICPDGKGNLKLTHSGEDGITQMGTIYAYDIGYDLVDTPVKMKTIFTFENVSEDGSTADVVVGVVINNSYRRAFRAEEVAVDTMPLGLFVYTDGSTNPFTISANELIPSGLIEVSPADFGIADDTYVTQENSAAKAVSGELKNRYTDADGTMTLDGKVFSADVKFAGTQSQLSIGGAGGASWYGFSLVGKGTEFVFQSNDSKSWCSMPALTIDPIVAGLSSAEDAFNLKISCEFEDSDGNETDDCIKFGVWINDKLYNNAYVYTTSIPSDIGCGAFICCQSEGGSITISTEEQERDDITPYILEEFGIESKVYTAETSFTKDMSGYAASIVKGNLTLTGKAWTSVYATKTRTGAGVRFYNTSGTLAYTCYTRNAADNGYITWPVVTVSEVAEGDSFKFAVSKEVLDLDMSGTANDVRIGIWINGVLHNKQYYYMLDCAEKLQQTVTLSPQNGSLTVQDSIEAESYNLANANSYLISGKGDLTVNDKTFSNGAVIQTPGDYIVRSAGKGTYVKSVVCYYPGDVNLNATLDVKDLVATKKYVSGIALTSKAANAASDFNRDGKVDETDCDALREGLAKDAQITTLKDNSLSYEDGVMPIAGFYAPYRKTDKNDSSYDLMTNAVYEKIAQAGINLINYQVADYRYAAQDVLDHLVLADKYNLDAYVTDTRVNGNMSNGELAKRLAGYSRYESFKGLTVVDEPNTDNYNKAEEGESITKKLADYKSLATKLNGFQNTTGYINLLPFRKTLNKSEDTLENAYRAYIDDYLTTNAKLLSWDFYVWDYSKMPNTYFANLFIMREKANTKGIPFWSYIQAGSNWNDDAIDLDSTTNTVPSKGQLLWNVNTSLAYGAKGIQYFPLIQPSHFAYENSEDQYDYDRNGLIGADGNTNVWYDYAVEANEQIKAVDEYLMYATSEAILAAGETAQTGTGIEADSYEDIIQSVEAQNGAIVGVFKYADKNLLYVVNYDYGTEGEDSITLNFENQVSYEVISKQQKAEGVVSNGSSTALTLSLVNGGAALVILD